MDWNICSSSYLLTLPSILLDRNKAFTSLLRGKPCIPMLTNCSQQLKQPCLDHFLLFSHFTGQRELTAVWGETPCAFQMKTFYVNIEGLVCPPCVFISAFSQWWQKGIWDSGRKCICWQGHLIPVWHKFIFKILLRNLFLLSFSAADIYVTNSDHALFKSLWSSCKCVSHIYLRKLILAAASTDRQDSGIGLFHPLLCHENKDLASQNVKLFPHVWHLHISRIKEQKFRLSC